MDINGVVYCSKCMRKLESEGVCPHCGYDPKIRSQNSVVLEEGTLLNGRFQLGAVIGRGGFGITYAAWDETLGMPVAVKEYFPQEYVIRDTEESDDVIPLEKHSKEYAIGLSRFVRESQVMAMLHEIPGVVKVLDCFGENETYYIAMEYIRGVPLDVYVKEKKLGTQKTIELMRQGVEALMAAHRQGVLHRDICPSNIMVQEDGSIKLIDFGAAAQVRRQQEGKDRSIILTEKYAAIEQYESGMGQGPWTDIYGLCATLYTVLTGENPPESVRRAMVDDIVPIGKKGIKIKKHQARAIMDGLAVQPEKRIRSMEEFRAILYDLPMPEEVLRRRRFMRRVYTASAAIMLIAAVIIVNFTTGLPLGKGLMYSLSASGMEVRRAIGEEATVEVPERVLGIPVTALAADAFANNASMKYIKLPGTISAIDDMSFIGCVNLERADISEGVDSVGAYAFADCPKLNTVYMPDSVEAISESAFNNPADGFTIWSAPDSAARKFAEENSIGWANSDEFVYEINDGEVTIVDYTGSDIRISVPSYIDGMPVTAFSAENAENVFPDELVWVSLPEGLKVLPTGLLTGKGDLEYVYLGSSLVEIEAQGLANTGLSELTLPATLKIIGDEAFLAMPIAELIIPDGVETIGEKAFCQSFIESIVLPDSVTSLGQNAFMACVKLESATLSSGIEIVPYNCFYRCKSLREVIIPEGIKVIEYSAFEECEQLASIALPDGIEDVGSMAFKYCTSLKLIRIPGSLENVGISVNAFIGCPNDMMIVGRDGTIAMRASDYFGYEFEEEYKLLGNDSITVTAKGGLWIEEGMEYTDTLVLPNLYYATDGSPVTVARVLEGTNINTRHLVMPRYIDEISTGAFAGVTGLETVSMQNCEEIKTMAFWNCRDLKHIDMPEGILRIDDSAFEKCVYLTDVELPGTLNYIGECAFFECGGVDDVVIPEGVVWLTDGCFGRTSLRHITVPGNVTVVGAAFYECEDLESAELEEGVRTLEASFYGCSNLREVHLPESVEWISQTVFRGCTSLEDVWIYSMDADFSYYDFIYMSEIVSYDEEANTIEKNDIVLERSLDNVSIFADCPNVVIHAYPGSTAEAYAEQYGIAFEPISDVPDILDLF